MDRLPVVNKCTRSLAMTNLPLMHPSMSKSASESPFLRTNSPADNERIHVSTGGTLTVASSSHIGLSQYNLLRSILNQQWLFPNCSPESWIMLVTIRHRPRLRTASRLCKQRFEIILNSEQNRLFCIKTDWNLLNNCPYKLHILRHKHEIPYITL